MVFFSRWAGFFFSYTLAFESVLDGPLSLFSKRFRDSHRRGGDLSFLNVGVPSCSRLAVGTDFEVLG